MRPDFLAALRLVFLRVVLPLRVLAALLAAFDLLVALAFLVLQPFLAAAERLALDGPRVRLAAFLLVLRGDLRLRVAAAFLADDLRLFALRLRVAAAFLAARDLLAAFAFLVLAAFLGGG